MDDDVVAAARTLGEALNAEFTAWFEALQSLTAQPLDPEEWTGRWYDGYTPAQALEDGPESDSDE